jgi:hypothetical protein
MQNKKKIGKSCCLVLLISLVVFKEALAADSKCGANNWDHFIGSIRSLQRASSCSASMSFSQCKDFMGLSMAGIGAEAGSAAAAKVGLRTRDKMFRVCAISEFQLKPTQKILTAYSAFVGQAWASRSNCFLPEQFLKNYLDGATDEIAKVAALTAQRQKEMLAQKQLELSQLQNDPGKAIKFAEQTLAQTEERHTSVTSAIAEIKKKFDYESLVNESYLSGETALSRKFEFGQKFHNTYGIRLGDMGIIAVEKMEDEIKGDPKLTVKTRNELLSKLNAWVKAEEDSSSKAAKIKMIEDSQLKTLRAEAARLNHEKEAQQAALKKATGAAKPASTSATAAKSVDPKKIEVLQEEINDLNRMAANLAERDKALAELLKAVKTANHLSAAELVAVHESIRALAPEIEDYRHAFQLENLRQFSSRMVAEGRVTHKLMSPSPRGNIVTKGVTHPGLFGFFARFPSARLASIGPNLLKYGKIGLTGLGAAALAPAVLAQEIILHTSAGGCAGLNSKLFPKTIENDCRYDFSLHDRKIQTFINLPEEVLCEKLKEDPELTAPLDYLFNSTYPKLSISCGPPIKMSSPAKNQLNGEIKLTDETISIVEGSRLTEESFTISLKNRNEAQYSLRLRNLNAGRYAPSHKTKTESWPPTDLSSRESVWLSKYNRYKPLLVEVGSCCSQQGITPSESECSKYGVKTSDRGGGNFVSPDAPSRR